MVDQSVEWTANPMADTKAYQMVHWKGNLMVVKKVDLKEVGLEKRMVGTMDLSSEN